ncbi:hypothetical protein SERLA73DRAFT_181390 [Serpula lacrymans var. lacrymans S7.3]|uniref:Uncharacterized protein n=2 Tax=Serpula lacrymans var. lacrymans TaxID=341189 RepID=F8PXZ5_SERL3|nr:uncharacterized protein SERLADRAFT_467510 [Serpula lacrymans var. lacrymans S7.9]EGN98758.1 hypothetical protein SERLA73DRAFT_181390 [Serpula lacrymans var. lacrymans S7.3]EGO24353.1 hypothetical protein SERLADRAFT_467510 [Serpula lacrymans var. lacrymans S7.9]
MGMLKPRHNGLDPWQYESQGGIFLLYIRFRFFIMGRRPERINEHLKEAALDVPVI